MIHANRGRLTVELGGKWRLYTNVVPVGSTPIGVITRGELGDMGALVFIEATGLYVQVNAGAVRSLPQSKIVAAVEAARSGTHGGSGRGQGRKTSDGATALTRKQVSLDADTINTLTALGDGELSLGIRRAAAKVKPT